MGNKSSIITILGISSLAALKKIGSANFGDIPEDSVLGKEIKWSLRHWPVKKYFNDFDEPLQNLYNRDFKGNMPLELFVYFARKFGLSYICLKEVKEKQSMGEFGTIALNYYDDESIQQIENIQDLSYNLIGTTHLPIKKLPNLKEISINFSNDDSWLDKKEQSIHDKKVIERMLSHAENTDSIEFIRLSYIPISSLDDIISAIPTHLPNLITLGFMLQHGNVGRVNTIPLSVKSFLKLINILSNAPKIKRMLITTMYTNPITVKMSESEAILLAKNKNIKIETFYNFLENSNINFTGGSDLRRF